VDSDRRRRSACASAHLQYAELLVSLSRLPEAARAYHEAERTLTTTPDAAQACYNAALVYMRMDNDQRAYHYLWRTVTHYPNEAFAADAMKHILRDGRTRAPEDLRTQLTKLSCSLAKTKIADNLLSALAQLEEHEFSAPERALALYDQLVKEHRSSGLFDDALWHGARLSRQLGDPHGAVERLRKLLATRVVALGAGSYFSVWLDDAQLELGIVLRDDLEAYSDAVSAFATLPSDYPDSILRDDALYERAVTKARMGAQEAACKDLSKLRKLYPDSKYELEKAPELRTQLGCAL
jgi:tetratricopeptide (TPR) repeat protein